MSVAIITGASSGIGRELARGLLSRGVDEFWLIARRRERLLELGAELGVKYKVLELDLTKEESLEALKEELCRERPSVKYLINAAGFGDFGAFDEIPDWDTVRMLDLNIKALVLITHMTVPYMERGGRIIELGSASAFTPLPYFNVYAASKAFVLHYSKALYYELKPLGIRSTCFCPGWVHTEFIDKALLGDRTRPRPEMLRPLLDCKKVVKKCLRASDKGKKIFVTGSFSKMQHLLFKLLPDGILSRGWLGMFDKKSIRERESRRGKN